MTKENKILLGVGLLGATAYLIFRDKTGKAFTNFTEADYKSCLNNVATDSKLLDTITASGLNGVSYCCNQVKGTLSGKVCTIPIEVSPEQTRCETQQGGIYFNEVCNCPSGYSMVNEICTIKTPPPPPNKEVTPPEDLILPEDITPPEDVTPPEDETPPPPPPSDNPIGSFLFFPSLGGNGGGGGGKKDTPKIFDWIPYIITGTTLTLAYIQEKG